VDTPIITYLKAHTCGEYIIGMRDVPTIPLSLHISSAQRQRKGQANNGKFCSLGGLEAGNGERIRNVECEMSVS